MHRERARGLVLPPPARMTAVTSAMDGLLREKRGGGEGARVKKRRVRRRNKANPACALCGQSAAIGPSQATSQETSGMSPAWMEGGRARAAPAGGALAGGYTDTHRGTENKEPAASLPSLSHSLELTRWRPGMPWPGPARSRQPPPHPWARSQRRRLAGPAAARRPCSGGSGRKPARREREWPWLLSRGAGTRGRPLPGRGAGRGRRSASCWRVREGMGGMGGWVGGDFLEENDGVFT